MGYDFEYSNSRERSHGHIQCYKLTKYYIPIKKCISTNKGNLQNRLCKFKMYNFILRFGGVRTARSVWKHTVENTVSRRGKLFFNRCMFFLLFIWYYGSDFVRVNLSYYVLFAPTSIFCEFNKVTPSLYDGKIFLVASGTSLLPQVYRCSSTMCASPSLLTNLRFANNFYKIKVPRTF